MAQQTAVSWLEENIEKDMTFMEVLSLIRQAKQMEKEQIMKAYKAHHDLGHIYGLELEQYYNETYNAH